MIDLNSLERMIANNKAHQSYYGPKAPRKLIGIANPEARYKSLKSTAKNSGIELGGVFRTLTGFSEWLSQFDPSVLTYDWCITCKCFDPLETIMNEHTAWIIPRWCMNYLVLRPGRKTNTMGVRLNVANRYQACYQNLYHGSYDSAMEAHQAWLVGNSSLLEQLLVDNVEMVDPITAARIRELVEEIRKHIVARTQIKQYAASKLDREALKQQYFNSLKETKQ